MPLPLDILHVTDRYAIIVKPSGLLSVPGKSIADCVAARVRAHFPNATGPLTVHRLDMETSGLIVFALDPAAHRDLSMQFEQREVEKKYIAILDGLVPSDEGEINLPLRADLARRPYQIVDFVQGAPATTRYRVLSRGHDTTRVEFTPITGKTHQLRVHAAAPGGLGHAILGDSLYGDKASAPRLMLHASFLAFNEPCTTTRVEFASDVPF